jgi:hypothetical protein
MSMKAWLDASHVVHWLSFLHRTIGSRSVPEHGQLRQVQPMLAGSRNFEATGWRELRDPTDHRMQSRREREGHRGRVDRESIGRHDDL